MKEDRAPNVPADCPLEERLRHNSSHTIVDSEHFDRGMGIVCDKLADLSDKVSAIHDGQAVAIAQALRAVLTDQETLSVAMGILLAELKRKAAEQTGQAVGGFVRTVLTRWLLIGLLIFTVAKLAGVEVAAKLWAALKGVP